jgi:PIN domain nuclease of toxin-antitoxin system
VRFLLDTHTFLWWITDDPHLSERARQVISDPENDIFLSAASGWEMAIKTQLGKLQLPDRFEQFIAEQLFRNNITSLPVMMSHALHVQSLPLHHRDPFDRLLIAQGQLEKMPIITTDSVFADYDVEIVW